MAEKQNNQISEGLWWFLGGLGFLLAIGLAIFTTHILDTGADGGTGYFFGILTGMVIMGMLVCFAEALDADKRKRE